ncbi:PapD-like protein [Apodospora peruviana]|uniref:PapD-like protein n=1 Tax=Apodospora peruviana TaxID=516989 RepID=A0AAE0MCA8_9PEZI|nr:PapD-like protein [Apodospora peruviana]
MSVEIDPLELGFRRPFTVEVAQILKIKNSNTSPVAFKVKTTAPKQYCVRPNSGRIEPGHDVEVSVLLQAMKTEPPADARCRDKFLVQSVTITGDKEFTNVQQIWDSVDRSAIQEKKIRVTWLAPSEDGHPEPVATPIRHSLANGVESTPDAAPPAYSSPNENSQEPSTFPVSEAETQNNIKSEPEPAKSTLASAQAATAATVASVKSTAAETYEDLKEKLAQAEATIASLKDDAVSGLRQRKAAAAAGADEKGVPDSAQGIVQAVRQGTEGVPVHWAAALCLISFLLAYFFF